MMTAKNPESGNPVLKVCGELRYGHGLSAFRARLDQALARQRRSNIIVDLEAVESVDSSGIGELVRALRQVTASGGRLTLLKPPPKVRRFLAATGLSAVFGLQEPPEFLMDQPV